MKRTLLSLLLCLSMVLTMLPTAAFAADGKTYVLPPGTSGLCEHHPEHDETCGYTPQTEDTAGTPCGHMCEICKSEDGGKDPAGSAGASVDTTPKALTGSVRPAATQYTYTLHYDANGGSGAPPSQSVTSSEFHVWVPISEIIPTRDGYTFKGWANSRTGKPIYGGNGGHTSCLVVHGQGMSTTIYAIWERKQPVKTVITTPPTLRLPAYVGNEYTDAALMGGEAKAEGTGVVVPGSFRFKNYEGGRVYPGENRMEILFTPDDTEAYTTAECIVTVTGIKRTVTSVPYDAIITDKPIGTAFADLGLPAGVKVETNTGASYSPIPVIWDSSAYNPNIYGEQVITGTLNIAASGFTDSLETEPADNVKAIARITLIDDRVFTPTLEPPTYSKQLYGADLCFLVFSDDYLSGGTATANGETVSGTFKLDKDQKIYGHSLTASTLLQAGPLQLKVIFTPDNLKRYTKAECTVDVNVIPRTFMEVSTGYLLNKKIGTTFEELNLSDSFSFYAVGDENDPDGTGSNYGMNVVTSWDSSTYDPNSFDEQTIYGEVDRARLEPYFTIPEDADLRAVIKVRLQPDPVDTEITQAPVFCWRNGDFTLPDNTIFSWRKLQVGTYNAEVGSLAGGVVKIKGTDTVAPGTFSFKEGTPLYLRSPGVHDVTVVFTPDDPRLHKPTETTIKINVIKNTIKDANEPKSITDKPYGTPFAELGLPKKVIVNGVDGHWDWIDVAWDEASYDAHSLEWQTITGTLVFDEYDENTFQQPDPAITAAIWVKLVGPASAPTIITDTLPDGTVDTAYSLRLFANGTEPITWTIAEGALPEGLALNETTGKITGTPTTKGTAVFTLKAKNGEGSDTKKLSITIAKAPSAEHTITVTSDGNGTGTASPSTAVAGTEITLTATPANGYYFKEWQVVSSTELVITNDKFTMPEGNVKVKAIFEKGTSPAPTELTVTFDGNGGTPSVGSMTTTNQKLSSLPDASCSGSYSFDGWYTEKSGGRKITTATVFSANATVYAHWTYTSGGYNPPVTDYTLRFETGGDSRIAEVQGAYNTYIDLTKYVPTRRGHTFIGWYSDRNLTEKVSGVYLTGDMTVYAGWRVIVIPQTGDSSQLDLWSIALCASLAGCLALVAWQRRRASRETAEK